MSPVLALSWGGLVIVALGAMSLGLLFFGLAVFTRDEIVHVEDPEARWAREAREAGR